MPGGSPSGWPEPAALHGWEAPRRGSCKPVPFPLFCFISLLLSINISHPFLHEMTGIFFHIPSINNIKAHNTEYAFSKLTPSWRSGHKPLCFRHLVTEHPGLRPSSPHRLAYQTLSPPLLVEENWPRPWGGKQSQGQEQPQSSQDHEAAESKHLGQAFPRMATHEANTVLTLMRHKTQFSGWPPL